MTSRASHPGSYFAGCYPVVPNDLVYPEYVPEHFRFDTENSEEKVGKNAAQLICKLLPLPGNKLPYLEVYSYNSVQKRYLDWLDLPIWPGISAENPSIGLNLVNFLLFARFKLKPNTI